MSTVRNTSRISPTVSLEVAKKLAPYYPQDQFPQWCWHGIEDDLRLWPFITKAMVSGHHAWYAAPSHLQALELCGEKGYPWERVREQTRGKFVYLALAPIGPPIVADGPDSLILAIIEHMEKDGAV